MDFDRLTELGQPYQSKTVISLITDREFLETVDDILYADYFDSEANQWIVNKTKDYFAIYKTTPTFDVFKVEFEKETNDVLKQEIIKKLRDAVEFEDSTDLKYIKENFTNFCINQHYKISLYKSIDDLKNGDYDTIKKRFDEASKVGQNKNVGLRLLSHSVEDVFTNIKRKTIPTPWDIINDITEGGSGDGETGELFIVVGGPGSGKSWTLTAVGTAALKLGLNVVHYTLELSETMTARRYYSHFTGIPAKDLEYSKSEIESRIRALNKKEAELVIKGYPSGTASVNTLRAHLNKLGKLDIKPDLILVDYADLLKPQKFHREKRIELSNIFVDLRGMSGEQRTPTWTASQANRSSADTDFIVGEQISEDYSKIMIGDFIMSISRKIEDNVNKTARVFTIKNRFGIDKILYPAKFDVSNGNLSIFEANTVQGKQAKGQMEDSKKSNLRELLRQKSHLIDDLKKENKS